MEGHGALVHTAAASNLGQMLNKLCIAEGVDLVNIQLWQCFLGSLEFFELRDC